RIESAACLSIKEEFFNDIGSVRSFAAICLSDRSADRTAVASYKTNGCCVRFATAAKTARVGSGSWLRVPNGSLISGNRTFRSTGHERFLDRRLAGVAIAIRNKDRLL
ncbi:hypothetical protein, partial [Ruegeria lacuscaerulensis]|uniref:hypothetical protein n=1 Tax=Ruegeria lacuscaerulensis TaxID=55218 RepID=UPI001BE45188